MVLYYGYGYNFKKINFKQSYVRKKKINMHQKLQHNQCNCIENRCCFYNTLFSWIQDSNSIS